MRYFSISHELLETIKNKLEAHEENDLVKKIEEETEKENIDIVSGIQLD